MLLSILSPIMLSIELLKDFGRLMNKLTKTIILLAMILIHRSINIFLYFMITQGFL